MNRNQMNPGPDGLNSQVLCPLTKMVAVKNFASDTDGHYDLDGVSFSSGEVYVAGDQTVVNPQNLAWQDDVLSVDDFVEDREEDDAEDETLEERDREFSHI